MAGEALVLSTWAGVGAVRLVRADPRRRAMLLEPLEAHRTLREVPVIEACEVVADDRATGTLIHPDLHYDNVLAGHRSKQILGLRLDGDLAGLALDLGLRQTPQRGHSRSSWLTRSCADTSRIGCPAASPGQTGRQSMGRRRERGRAGTSRTERSGRGCRHGARTRSRTGRPSPRHSGDQR